LPIPIHHASEDHDSFDNDTAGVSVKGPPSVASEVCPEGIEEWIEIVDQALHGLHHALNNRIGSLSALVELHQFGEVPTDDLGLSSLEGDIKRLQECNRMVRLLPRDGASGEEALILDDVFADVFAIHRYLHDLRELSVTIVPSRYVEPVRVERWALVRVLTILLSDAKRLARDADTNVRALTESDEQWVRIEFRVGSPSVIDTPTARGRYAETIAASFGGVVERQPGSVVLRLPTLKARRAAAGR
jgi:hypothetical protein